MERSDDVGLDDAMFRDDVGLDGAMFRGVCVSSDFERSCGVINAEEMPAADTMAEQRRAVMDAASGVMNDMVKLLRWWIQ